MHISRATKDFEIEPAQGEETADESLSPDLFVSALAENKAAEIAASHPDDIVIGADNIVAAGREILGKPAYAEDAKRMLTLLSGTQHSVYTGVTVSKGEKSVTFSEKTDVEFNPMTAEEIEEYISSSEPYDKAGSYAVQGKACVYIKGLNGDYFNVVGLPVSRLYKELLKLVNN